jgi:mono/diheme cytochrome c family protein
VSGGRSLGGLCAALALGLAAVPASGAGPDSGQDYLLSCQGCHGPEGRGVRGRVPPLADTFALLLAVPEGRDFLLRVPGAANSHLSDQALAGVLNWLAARYAPAVSVVPFTAADVADGRRRPLPSVRAARLAVAERLAASGLTLDAAY